MLAAHKRFPSVVTTVFLVYLAVQPLTARSATYDYGAPQVAPSIAATLDTPQIAAILNETAPNKPYLVAYQLKTTDANDNTAAAKNQTGHSFPLMRPSTFPTTGRSPT